MAYLVTGGTGFIGRFLIDNLVEREGPVYVVVRKGSVKKLEALKARWGTAAERVIPVVGDLAKPKLGLSTADMAKLKGKVKHFFHLAAIYDLSADAASQETANIEGTRNAVELAEAVNAGCFHHVSSIAAAGLYDGVFREDMFEDAEDKDHPYFHTKHESEGIVRRESKVPFRIYRPGIVVGHSKTGEIDKIDGPYYFFKLIQKMRNALPPWVPTVGIEGGRINIVPVDFVADAIDHIAHKKGLDGGCFHLTDPEPMRVGEVLNAFAKAAHAPQMTMRLNAKMFSFIPSFVLDAAMSLAPVRRIQKQLLADLGIPKDMFTFINYPTRFDNREAAKALKGSGIEVPRLEDYAWRLWDYWERHLDPDLFIDRSLAGKVKDKVVVVTGGTSGIGEATAYKLAEAGARVVVVARDAEKAVPVMAKIKADGGDGTFVSCDLSSLEDCDKLVATVLKKFGRCDYLVNNAGRSIRRGIASSYDRFHDFERTMQLNYFGSLRLIMGFLPSMVAQNAGHIINISSIGVLTRAPRFSAYVSSKAALDAFADCAASEFIDNNVHFTTINMPLVRTPMIAPTKLYNHVPTLSPEQAADLVVEAVVYKPVRIATRLGIFGEILHAVAPKATQIILNTAFRMFPDSGAAQGKKKDGEAKEVELTPEQIAFAQITQGIHW
ncbi:3-phenylpropionate-dihydrodiol/cinnamic acid-dihydrodiol dehydrogenase [Usitatibacter rugosus]|uniref:3-phenylpropionate-dihydrodiol/cinnamic acid-dihydrodiol dehydrogenase n=1 Tax=Usitatibacter rugosus TaxID=2732067 RepID=A0A6M4GUX6_9PROT|nr:SDR family oxidoreductase [Usitatibacter rugosus]QJR11109.1 3-phenylpropionate-dihydrodiol/cinnamic acid-dihydrodiol dehydrogenase [Usitatibacter rugosus]